jgi:hypothetical protein
LISFAFIESKVLELRTDDPVFSPIVPARALTPPPEIVIAAAAPSVCTKFLREIFMGILLLRKLKPHDCILVRKISQENSYSANSRSKNKETNALQSEYVFEKIHKKNP